MTDVIPVVDDWGDVPVLGKVFKEFELDGREEEIFDHSGRAGGFPGVWNSIGIGGREGRAG